MRTAPLCLFALALALASRGSVADPPPDASAPTKVVIPPWPEDKALPALDAEPFPEDKSKAPSLDDWKSAPQVAWTRVSRSREGICTLKRLREWIKVRCDKQTAGMRVIAGGAEGVSMPLAIPIPSQNDSQGVFTAGRFGEIIFPLRRGDRRVFQWFFLNAGVEDYNGQLFWGVGGGALIEATWQEGATPVVALN
jgi:hypothetical protein